MEIYSLSKLKNIPFQVFLEVKFEKLISYLKVHKIVIDSDYLQMLNTVHIFIQKNYNIIKIKKLELNEFKNVLNSNLNNNIQNILFTEFSGRYSDLDEEKEREEVLIEKKDDIINFLIKIYEIYKN